MAKNHPEVIAKIEEYLKIARTDSESWPISKAKKQQGTKKPNEQ